jgi:hypothetical protein
MITMELTAQQIVELCPMKIELVSIKGIFINKLKI